MSTFSKQARWEWLQKRKQTSTSNKANVVDSGSLRKVLNIFFKINCGLKALFYQVKVSHRGLQQLEPVLEGLGQPQPVLEGLGQLQPVLEGLGQPLPVLEGPGQPQPVLEGLGQLQPVLEGLGQLQPVLEGLRQLGAPKYSLVRHFCMLTCLVTNCWISFLKICLDLALSLVVSWKNLMDSCLIFSSDTLPLRRQSSYQAKVSPFDRGILAEMRLSLKRSRAIWDKGKRSSKVIREEKVSKDGPAAVAFVHAPALPDSNWRMNQSDANHCYWQNSHFP